MEKEELWAMLTAPTFIPFETYKAIMTVLLGGEAAANGMIE